MCFDHPGLHCISSGLRSLRREQRLKLPDALIAATALTRDAVLLTNDRQLVNLPGLQCQTLKLRVTR